MPLYEYRCEACGHQFEVIRKFSDPPLATCASCGGAPVVKLLSSPAIQFKGEGWYITDYARKDQKAREKTDTAAAESKGGESGKSSSSTDAAPSSPPAPAGSSSKPS